MSIEVRKINDENFRQYGRIIRDYDVAELVEKMADTILEEGVVYIPSDADLEKLSVYHEFANSFYGGLPIQIGYCNGYNKTLNALEYHRSSEVNIAATDMILLLGRQQDITPENTYDTSKVEAFFIPKNTVVEVYATTLHYAPCSVDGKAFRCVVILPKDTNLELVNKGSKEEDKLLAARNKWLLAHKDAGIENAHIGLIGENITL